MKTPVLNEHKSKGRSVNLVPLRLNGAEAGPGGLTNIPWASILQRCTLQMMLHIQKMNKFTLNQKILPLFPKIPDHII